MKYLLIISSDQIQLPFRRSYVSYGENPTVIEIDNGTFLTVYHMCMSSLWIILFENIRTPRFQQEQEN